MLKALQSRELGLGQINSVVSNVTKGLGSSRERRRPVTALRNNGLPFSTNSARRNRHRRARSHALAEHHGNATLVCRSLGIPKRTLYDKMRKLGLSTTSDTRGRRS